MAATGLLATLTGTYVSCSSAVDAKNERYFAQEAANETAKLRDQVVALGDELLKTVHRSSTNDARNAWSSYFSYCEPAINQVDFEQCALKTELLLLVLKDTLDSIDMSSSQISQIDDYLISDSYKRVCRYSSNVDVEIYRGGMAPPMPSNFETKIDSLLAEIEQRCKAASVEHNF